MKQAKVNKENTHSKSREFHIIVLLHVSLQQQLTITKLLKKNTEIYKDKHQNHHYINPPLFISNPHMHTYIQGTYRQFIRNTLH